MQSDIAQLKRNLFTFSGVVVDAKRGEIRCGEHKTALEPKVMMVLLYLASNAEQVVEQEALFNAVWPQSLFSPNSLRRCIATLRKALNDRDKTLIQTHPKIGYSLNTSIELLQPSALPQPIKAAPNRLSWVALLSALLLLLVYLVLSQSLSTQPDNKLPHVKEMLPLTATNELEDNLAIDTHGEYMAFTRTSGDNSQTLWLKEVASGHEIALNVSHKNIRSIAWSKTDAALYYTVSTERGWIIYRLQLNSTKRPLPPTKVLENPVSSWISKLVVGKDDAIYFIARKARDLIIFKADTKMGSSERVVTPIYSSPKTFRPYDLTLAPNGLVVSGQNQHEQGAITVLSLSATKLGKVIDTYTLDGQQRYNIEWWQNYNGFLLNNGRKLYFLSSDGSLKPVDFEHNQFIRFVAVDSVNNRVYLVSSRLDMDLLAVTQDQPSHKKIIDSNGMDYFPAVSPQEDLILFYSTRFNKPQLFMLDRKNNSQSQLFDNPDEYLNVSRPLWCSDQTCFAYSVGGELYHYSLEDNTQFKVPNITGRPLAWYPDNLHLLVLGRSQGENVLYKVNSHNGMQSVLAKIEVGNPFISQNGEVYLEQQGAIYHLKENQARIKVAELGEIQSRRISRFGIYVRLKQQAGWHHWQPSSGLTPLFISVENGNQLAAFSESHELAILSQEARQKDILSLVFKQNNTNPH